MRIDPKVVLKVYVILKKILNVPYFLNMAFVFFCLSVDAVPYSIVILFKSIPQIYENFNQSHEINNSCT